jgi:hypothetical protein
VVGIGVEKKLQKPANNDGFEDYGQWVQNQSGHKLLSNHKNTIVNESDLEKVELSHHAKQNEHENGTPLPSGEPNITYDKDGDAVSKIKIHCTCGELIELDLDY